MVRTTDLTFDMAIEKLGMYNKIMENTKNSTIRRGVLMFIHSGKVKLAEFSSSLGRAKSTIIHHLKKFEKLEVITKNQLDTANQLGENEYFYNVDFEQVMNLQLSDFGDLTEEERETIVPLLMKKDYETFRIYNKLIYYAMLEIAAINDKRLKGEKMPDGRDPMDVYNSHSLVAHSMFLTKEEGEEYRQMIDQFAQKIANRRAKEPRTDEIYEHMVFSGDFNIAAMVQFDPDQMRFVKQD